MSDDRDQVPAVIERTGPITPPATLHVSLAVPAMVANAGDRAAKRFLEFFAAAIENHNTAMAYYRAVGNFFNWLEHHRIGELDDIEPLHVAAYLKALTVSEPGKRSRPERKASDPTIKQHLRQSACCSTGSSSVRCWRSTQPMQCAARNM